MKKILLTLLLSFIGLTLNAQSASVENETNGIQLGILGIWGHHEAKLSNTIALRSEIGFDSGIWGGKIHSGTGFIMAPVITLEPRLYYNLKKRENKNRRIDGNSGNFISLKSSYHPDWFVISNNSNVSIIPDFAIVPTWGIKRNIGRYINYEAGIGIGYRYIFAKQVGYRENKSETTLNLHLRFGFRL